MNVYRTIIAVFLSIVIGSCGTKSEETVSKTEVSNGIATSTFKVWGNCEMCKETIEGSLKEEGILKSDWNVDTKIMTVEFDTAKISLDQIQKNIAIVGYDDEKYKADDKTYSSLPECCQYDRKK